ncbi:MAG: fasciclin domain-containing protein [Hyphomicrobium sp.]|nr:MAG: fasciclin domain-containing protein [Hyphomicrobium sp.]
MNRTKMLCAAVFALSLSTGIAANSFAMEKTVEVGGAAMYPSKNIIENAVNSKDHTTLVAAVKAAGLVKTLEGKGPFTVFAPTNAAFDKLPDGTVANLLKPENKTQITNVLTYHVVAGDYSAAKLSKEAKANGGKVDLKTVEGEHIKIEGDNMGGWWVVDGKGDKAKITIADVNQSNGVIHVIDGVLLPN